MKHLVNDRVLYSILFYVLVLILILLVKPSAMFDEKSNLKPFGVGQNKTILSLGVVTVALAIVSYYLFCVIDLVFGK